MEEADADAYQAQSVASLEWMDRLRRYDVAVVAVFWTTGVGANAKQAFLLLAGLALAFL